MLRTSSGAEVAMREITRQGFAVRLLGAGALARGEPEAKVHLVTGDTGGV
jgi:hypothetical protein